MKVELQAFTKPTIDVEPKDFPAYIARIGKIKDNPEKLVKFLIKHKHWSPFEHSFVTFKIETSRAMGRELLRHRSFTFQELSQRYEEVLEFEPVELRKKSEENRQSSTDIIEDKYFVIDNIIGTINLAYQALLSLGVAKECARMILPECTKTTILMTGSVRSWIHFLEIRDESRAQKEVQLIAKEIKKVLIEQFPMIFSSLKPENENKSITVG